MCTREPDDDAAARQLRELEQLQLPDREPDELELFAVSDQLFGARRGWNR